MECRVELLKVLRLLLAEGVKKRRDADTELAPSLLPLLIFDPEYVGRSVDCSGLCFSYSAMRFPNVMTGVRYRPYYKYKYGFNHNC